MTLTWSLLWMVRRLLGKKQTHTRKPEDDLKVKTNEKFFFTGGWKRWKRTETKQTKKDPLDLLLLTVRRSGPLAALRCCGVHLFQIRGAALRVCGTYARDLRNTRWAVGERAMDGSTSD